MKSYYTIGEISKMFNIPASTIRFWDDAGCIHLKRAENGYRCFDLAAMIDLCRLILYRDLDIPIQAMKRLPETGADGMDELLENIKNNMFVQIKQLQKKIAAINEKQRLIQLQKKLETSPYTKSEIPFEKIIKFGFSNKDLIKYYFENQHSLVLVMKEENNYIPTVGFAVDNHFKSDSVLWHKNSCNEFVQFLLKVRKNDIRKNDLNLHMSLLEKNYSKPKVVIAQYIDTTLDNNILMDYNCAWASVY